jgi:mannobiose 2-epimerase
MGIDKLKEIRKEIKDEFENHMIPFWLGLKDEEHGGYYGLVNFDLSLDKKADKGCIVNSRILWFFSRAYTKFGDEKYLHAAEHAFHYLMEAFLDDDEGGVYWSVNFDGHPADTTKHTYCQAFAIYALAAYYEATKDKDALECAYDLYHIIEDRCRDNDGYLEAFTREFEVASNEKLSENGVMATRTMNTLLHVMEAYTELYRVDGDKLVKRNIIETLKIFREKMFDAERGRLLVFFDKDYDSLIDLYSYGHDIESAWLIDRTVDIISGSTNGSSNEKSEYDMSDITSVLTESIYKEAFKEDGMPAEAENGVVLETRIWWVQCEAILGFMNAYTRIKNASESDKGYSDYKKFEEDYKNAAISIWEYTKKSIVDKRPGSEWYSEVRKDGAPIETKPMEDIWKCPYHNGRMFLEMMDYIEE